MLGYYSTTQVSDETGKPAPFDVLRICANNINDVMLYLKKWESDFDVRLVKLVGMAICVSGMPYWG